jgi:Uma2 family endonuclease
MATGPATDYPLTSGSTASFTAAPAESRTSLPRLEPGDRLTRAEFERRYEAMPEVKKAELLEGVVHMPSPTRFLQHGKPHWNVIAWLSAYEIQTPGIIGGDNTTLRFDNDNMPQPDALLMIEPACGGQARIGAEGYIEGAPELVAEIASSSVSIDLHDKLNVYRRCGVSEYVVWRVLDRAIDWFILREGQYVPMALGEGGILRSEVFPGLWLNAAAMLEGKLDVVLATLQQGIATPEHKDFVTRLLRQEKK